MSLGGAIARPSRARLSALAPRWSAAAWCAVGFTVAFIALTVWWLAEDTAVPYGDSAEALWAAFRFREFMLDGDVGGILDYPIFYPSYGFMLGGLTAIVGGVHRNAVVLGSNLVCVPLLALGCYHVGRRAAGAAAGALAVLFALGSPLLIEHLHVFMIDTFMAALVAVSVWLILASERFSRLGVAALAGVAVGLGVGTKEQFPLYLAAFVLAVLVRGGWRNVRGFATFAGVALAIAAPWYVHNAEKLGMIRSAGGSGDGFLFEVPLLARPPLLSTANVEWYGWATLNGLLFAPLTAFAVVGVAAALWRLRQPSERAGVLPELVVGLVGSWLALTILTHKDLRYTLPMIVYFAVLGTAWIVHLRGLPRALATAGLGAAVVATTLGMTFGVGGAIPERLPGNLGSGDGIGVPPRDTVVVYSNHDYLVSGPRRDADLLSVLRGLQQAGVTEIYWDPAASGPEHADFNGAGLGVLARTAKLAVAKLIAQRSLLPGHALLIYGRSFNEWPPCMRYADGNGVWALISPVGQIDRAVLFCPGRGLFGPPIRVPEIDLGRGASALP